MGFFDRFRPRPVPAWASSIFANATQWAQFANDAIAAIRTLDPQATLDDAEGVIAATIEGNAARFGLNNIARKYRDSEDGAEVMRWWIDQLTAQIRSSVQVASISWDAARPRLRVQLYNDERQRYAPMVARKLCDDLWLAVVIDSDTSVLSVSLELVAAWEQPEQALFDRALANMSDIAVELDRTRAPLLLAARDDDYNSAVAYLRLADTFAGASHGGLVTFPTRFTTVLLPLAGPVADSDVLAMLGGTDGLFAEGVGPITPNLYWWRAGTLALVPAVANGKSIEVTWPAELDEVVTARR